MLKLFGHPVSLHSRKVHFALEELGITHTYHLVDLLSGEQHSSAFRALNPSGKVPVLQDGELQLPESGAILRYLGENYGDGKLLPQDKQLRARVDQWLFWQATEGGPVLIKPFFMRLMERMKGTPPDDAAFQQAVQACDAPLKHLDEALAGKDFLVGDVLTIADIALSESIFQLQMVGVGVSQFGNVQRWFSGISARKAFQATRPQG